MATKVAGKLGKLDPQIPHSLADVAQYLTVKPPQPRASVPVPPVSSWPMDGNDANGDCVFAAKEHDIRAFNALVGTKDATPSEQQVVDLYYKLTGGEDTGYVISNALALWHRSGLWANKIVGYAPVKAKSLVDLHLAIDLFGLADIGIQVPQSVMEQFDAGKPWTVVKNSPIEGGHDIILVGYDQHVVYGVSWGEVVEITYPFIANYMDEAWAIIGQEYQTAGHGPKLDLASLEKDLPLLNR